MNDDDRLKLIGIIAERNRLGEQVDRYVRRDAEQARLLESQEKLIAELRDNLKALRDELTRWQDSYAFVRGRLMEKTAALEGQPY